MVTFEFVESRSRVDYTCLCVFCHNIKLQTHFAFSDRNKTQFLGSLMIITCWTRIRSCSHIKQLISLLITKPILNILGNMLVHVY